LGGELFDGLLNVLGGGHTRNITLTRQARKGLGLEAMQIASTARHLRMPWVRSTLGGSAQRNPPNQLRD
jgi:hypothetical protein